MRLWILILFMCSTVIGDDVMPSRPLKIQGSGSFDMNGHAMTGVTFITFSNGLRFTGVLDTLSTGTVSSWLVGTTNWVASNFAGSNWALSRFDTLGSAAASQAAASNYTASVWTNTQTLFNYASNTVLASSNYFVALIGNTSNALTAVMNSKTNDTCSWVLSHIGVSGFLTNIVSASPTMLSVSIAGSNVTLTVTPSGIVTSNTVTTAIGTPVYEPALLPYATLSFVSNNTVLLSSWTNWLATNALASLGGDNVFTGSNSFPTVYLRQIPVTNIIVGGVTNWVGGTGQLQAYDSFPDDPTVLGTNSIFTSEISADQTLRVAGTTNIIGDVLGVQDDGVLWTWGVPQNISGGWFDFEIGTVADATNVVMTNGPIAFADGSLQRTAWSNTVEQLNSIFGYTPLAPNGDGSQLTGLTFDAIGSAATVQSNLSAYAQYGATQTWTAAQLFIATNTFDAITFFNGPLFAFAHTNLYAYAAPNGNTMRALYHSRMSSASPLTTNQLLALYALTPYDKPLGSALGVIDSRAFTATNAPTLWVSGSNGVQSFWVTPNNSGGVAVGASEIVFTNASPTTIDIRTQRTVGVSSLVPAIGGLGRAWSNENGSLVGYLTATGAINLASYGVALADGTQTNISPSYAQATNISASVTSNAVGNLPWCASYTLTTNALTWSITGWPMVAGSRMMVDISGQSTNASTTSIGVRWGGLTNLNCARHIEIQGNGSARVVYPLGFLNAVAMPLSFTNAANQDGVSQFTINKYASEVARIINFTGNYVDSSGTNVMTGTYKLTNTNIVNTLDFSARDGGLLRSNINVVITISPGATR